MPKIDLDSLPVRTGSIYPPPHDREVAGRSSVRVGDAGGLTQFGANIVTLQPGARASMRHWHENEDEFLMMLTGALDLVDDHGTTPMKPGDCAAFPAGEPNGHHMVNNSGAVATFLVVGSKAPREVAHYPDHGLRVEVDDTGAAFKHEDGRPFTGPE